MRFLRRFLARFANFAIRRKTDQRLREEMEEVLVAKDRSHGSALPLKALLGKIIIASDER